MDKAVKHSDITITIGLDESNVPVTMRWQAENAGQAPQECKAMLLSLFDRESLDTLKIDLWTKDMQVIEMDRFFFSNAARPGRYVLPRYPKCTTRQRNAAIRTVFWRTNRDLAEE